MKKPLILFFILLWATSSQNCPANCVSCSSGQLTSSGESACTQCIQYFFVNSAGECGLYTPLDGCEIYVAANPNRCNKCFQTHQIYDGRCLLKPANCKVSNRISECTQCQNGYAVVKGNCYSNSIRNCPIGTLPTNEDQKQYCWPFSLINCELVGANGICDRCLSGYELVNGLCYKLRKATEPCANCPCIDGAPVNDKCYYILLQGCTIGGATPYPTFCKACQNGLAPIRGTCVQPVKLDDINCNVVQSGLCTGCNQNYDLNKNAYCVKNFNYTVDVCSSVNTFEIYQNKCFYKDVYCESIDFNSPSAPCLRCRESFVLRDGVCVREGCIRFDLTRNRCIEAYSGYSIVGQGEIIRNPNNCLDYDAATNTCLRCSTFTQYLPISRTSTQRACIFYNENCATYSTEGICQSCNTGFTILNRQCIQNVKNCQVYLDNDLTKCDICDNGYRKQPTNNRCYLLQEEDSCLVYQFGSNCKECKPNDYILSNMKCFNINKFDQNCQVFTAGGYCQRCRNGFMPYQNLCVYFDPSCLAYAADGSCSQAAAGFSLGSFSENDKASYRNFILAGYLSTTINAQTALGVGGGSGGVYSDGGVISSMPYAGIQSDRIAKWNLQGAIQSCKPQYIFTKNFCFLSSEFDSLCLQYNARGQCIKCSPSTYMSEQYKCISGNKCAPNSNLNGRCTSCISGFTLIGDFCMTDQSESQIQSWVSKGGYFRYNSIAWLRLENCLSQVELNRCDACASGFSIHTDGRCVRKIDNCVQYDRNGICSACSSGYLQWSGACRVRGCTNPNNLGYCPACPINYVYNFGFCISSSRQSCIFYANGQCIQCQYGFYLSSAGVCQRQINRCLRTNPDTGRCLECRSGNTIYQDRCYKQTKYCTEYDRNEVCLTCSSSVFLKTRLADDKTCVKLEGQCSGINTATKSCNQCNRGYQIRTQDNVDICVAVKPNCFRYDISGKCVQCQPRYTLQDNFCRLFIQGCITYNEAAGTCLSCRNNIIPSQNGYCCKAIDNNCVSYKNCICSACREGYYLNSLNFCVPNPLNCLNYNSMLGRCLLCAPDYYLRADGRCIFKTAVTNGCETGYNITIQNRNWYNCIKCYQGFYLNSTDTICYGFNCLLREPDFRHCLSCPVYYKLSQNAIATRNYCIPFFCNDYRINQTVCADGSSSDGAYIQLPSKIILRYCTDFDAAGNCLACSNYRYPNRLTQYYQCYPSNCQTTNDFNCPICKTGFVTDSRYPGSCIAQYCDSWNINGTCLQCRSPYTVSSTGICENRGCCEVVSPVTGNCQIAKKYYTIDLGICIPNNCAIRNSTDPIRCQTCKEGFFLSNGGICQPLRCRIETATGSGCQLCQDGYGVLNGICVPVGCKNYDSNYICIECLPGYYLDNGLCRIQNCLREQGYVCLQCQKYYVLVGGVCRVNNCETFSATGACTCCQYQYALNPVTLLCQPNEQFCQKSNNISGLCETCRTNFKLVSGKCVNEVPFCKSYDLTGCSICQPGYEKSQCFCRPKNCKTFGSDGRCIECNTRFQLVDGKCRPRDCQTFIQAQWRCGQCFERFQYINDTCVSIYCQVFEDLQNTICKICISPTGSFITTSTGLISRELILLNGGCYIRGCVVDPRQLFCKTCSPGYNLSFNGYCTCQNFNEPAGICQCPTGMISNSNGTCYINPDPCLYRLNSTQCLTCPGQYRLSNGECTGYDCLQWNKSIYKCSVCKPNFSLVNGFCRYNLCLRFQNVDGYVRQQCTMCQDGYNPFDVYCIPKKCKNETYNFETLICKQCELGYKLSADSKRCVPANCQDMSIPCKQCLPGFDFLGEICLSRNCKEFDAVTCLACIEGYQLTSQGNCEAKNCKTYNTSRACSECNGNYALRNGLCLNCKPSYYLDLLTAECLPYRCQGLLPNKTQCLNCIQGYYKENGTCIDINCKINSFNLQLECTGCKQYFAFNPNNRLCEPAEPDICPKGQYFSYTTFNCEQIGGNCLFQKDNTCIWCKPGYFLYNKLCYSLLGCSKYSYFYGCFECKAGFRLQGRQCIQSTPDIPHCAAYTNNRCTLCQQKYYLDTNGLCVQKIISENCEVYDPLTNQCLKCFPGFFLQNKLCYVNYCSDFLPTRFCRTCQAGYQLQNGYCYKTIPSCSLYNITSSLCQTCAVGFYLQDGFCFKVIPGCVAYNQTTSSCRVCNNTYKLQGGLCYKIIDNCLTYADIGLCQVCFDGYKLSNGYCAQAPVDPNCLQYNLTTNQCLVCKTSFELRNGLCYVKYCSTHLDSRFCQTCIAGYTLKNGYCYKTITGCSVYDQSTELCFTCLAGFSLQNGLCYKTIDFCQSYNANTGLCSLCYNRYKLLSGRCSPIQVDPFCSLYDPTSVTCLQCLKGFSLNNNLCYVNYCSIFEDDRLCRTCLPGYTLQNKYCFKQINGCSFYGAITGLCDQCSSGYTLQNGLCYKVINWCSYYANSGICQNCIQGYVLQNGYCYSRIQFCIEYGVSTGLCVRCQSGYRVNNGLCEITSKDNFCQTYTPDNSRCLECLTGFQLRNTLCYAKFCSNYLSSRLCQTCLPNYFLQQGYCYSIIQYCQIYAPTGVCSQCLPGYNLENQGRLCQQIDFPYCYYSGPVSCSICQFRYYLDSQVCTAYPKYCTNIDPLTGQCISCCFGSRLSNGVCIKEGYPKCVVQNNRCTGCISSEYQYCEYCDMCVPVRGPNCEYFQAGKCQQCSFGYNLIDGRCIALGTGYISSSSTQCAQNYLYQDGKCVMNSTMLSVHRSSTFISTSRNQSVITTISTSNEPMIIFAMQFKSSTSNQQVVFYFKNSAQNPLICWNSCLPLKITQQSQRKDLTFPIIATQIRAYILKGTPSNFQVDYQLMK